MSRRLPVVVALLAAFSVEAAVAQSSPPPSKKIYKVQMPDGSVVYTDSVPRGAKVLEQREGQPQLTIPPPVAPRPAGAAPAATKGPSAIDRATAEVDAAERALADAKATLEQAREPQEGDRIGLKGGGSRLTPEYEERIRRLEMQVTQAEDRLRKAHEARNAAR
jgi:hypothetical protein